jgi:hypothetical protein
MRKRFLVDFVVLLAVAALLPFVRDAFQRRADRIPLAAHSGVCGPRRHS